MHKWCARRAHKENPERFFRGRRRPTYFKHKHSFVWEVNVSYLFIVNAAWLVLFTQPSPLIPLEQLITLTGARIPLAFLSDVFWSRNFNNFQRGGHLCFWGEPCLLNSLWPATVFHGAGSCQLCFSELTPTFRSLKWLLLLWNAAHANRSPAGGNQISFLKNHTQTHLKKNTPHFSERWGFFRCHHWNVLY